MSLASFTLPASSYCTITLDVTGVTAGTKENSVTVTSTNGGTGNTSTDTLYVEDLTPALGLKKQISTGVNGPWLDFVTGVPVGASVYYKFTVENLGEVPLTNVSIVDPGVSSFTCYTTDATPQLIGYPIASLPVAVVANDYHIVNCYSNVVTAIAGVHQNTAYASGTYTGTVNSNNDFAWYSTPANYGHLPYSDYVGMNFSRKMGLAI